MGIDAEKTLKISGSALENRARIHITMDDSDVGSYVVSMSAIPISVEAIDLALERDPVFV